ncbi:hypothetical protein ACH5RR_019102 [Cinchona calisaya]|uniref:F-box domain-containing protein n=1 Tax=Cinchona calisaya TaxID=153742 RepID=A0ABD2ZTJ8_9GENT
MKFKKQILRGLVGCGSLTLPQLPDELVLEILRRLPAKNLIRCKSLSKAWCSTLENPSFMEAYFKDYYTHHRHFGALLVSTVDLRLGMGYPPPILLCFNYSPLIPLRDAELESESELKSKLFLKVLPSPLYIGATKVVNGLVCVYEAKRVMVCNVYTGEIMWLPSIDSDSNSNSTTLNDYYFGYDPVNGVYKLIRVSSSEFRFRGDFSIRKRADIITLSPSSTPSSWRNLDMGHHEPRTFPDESFLFNGVLYWVMHEGLGEQCGLLCLDLNTEEFHFIRPPQQPFFSSANGSPWRIARFMERLALLVPESQTAPALVYIYPLMPRTYAVC